MHVMRTPFVGDGLSGRVDHDVGIGVGVAELRSQAELWCTKYSAFTCGRTTQELLTSTPTGSGTPNAVATPGSSVTLLNE